MFILDECVNRIMEGKVNKWYSGEKGSGAVCLKTNRKNMEDNSGKVTVYKVRIYDIQQDAPRVSRRMATEAGAKKMGGEILPETATLIEAEDLECGEQWTPRDYKPRDI
jgi:hypothetical protein